MRNSISITLVTILLSGIAAAQDYIWVEGEDAVRHNMTRHGWYDSVNKDGLSGNEWLPHFDGAAAGEAEYRFDVPVAGSYHFWVRANVVAGPSLSYKLGDGDWTPIDLSDSSGNINIAADGKPDMRFIAWVNVGEITLPQGPTTFRFRCDSGNSNHGAIDCFVFTKAPFMPRGALKPGARSGKAAPGFFAWEPSTDPYSSDAVVDLSFLNEDTAGQNGYVRARDNDLVLGNGEQVRFWAANAGPGIAALDHAAHVYLAKSLAKRGVNLVRIHGGIYSSNDPAVSSQRLDNLHHLVSALKAEGIYTKLSFYFPAWFRLDDWHRQGDRWPFMLLFFDEDMQKVYFNWANGLLKTPNPYTGLPLGKDPAVAMVEIQNEDSHFFWTFGEDAAPPPRWGAFCRVYGDWLADKYGSLDAAYTAWGGARHDKDAPAEGRMHLHDIWMLTSDGKPGNAAMLKRISDQTRFMTENMRGFYSKAIQYFREDCGYAGLVSCGNWHTADAKMLDALERYCYTAGDVIDHHGYFDQHHEGEAASYSVRPGHTMQSASALTLEASNPLPYVETLGHPHITSEIGWPMPNAYRAEATFLCSAYGALWGLDGIMNFAIGSASWDESASKFVLNNPAALGTYFAAALVYRRGYVKEAPVVVRENLRIEDQYQLEGSNVYVRPALDQFRAAQIPEGERSTGAIETFDPLTFYIGRVARSFDGAPADSYRTGVEQLIDRDAKTVRSINGALAWNYGAAVATMNTPEAQGAAGFLGRKGPVRLDNVSIAMRNDYGTVTVASIDGKPLAESSNVLIQCMTRDQRYGWKTSSGDGLSGTIQDVGAAPWGVQKIDAEVELRVGDNSPRRIIQCDENGYPVEGKTRQATPRDGVIKIRIDPETVYTTVSR